MKNRFVFTVLLFLLVISFSTNLFAFDNNRKGFVLGIGVGPALTSYTQEVVIFSKAVTSDRENAFGVATDFKIGYGASENFMIYYVNKVTWFSMDNALGSSVTIANGVGLLGVSYFLEPVAPSFYLTGTIGLSTWMAPFEDGSSTWTGFGVAAGGGYEFKEHWTVEAGLMWGKPGDTEMGIDVSTNALGVMFTINYLAY